MQTGVTLGFTRKQCTLLWIYKSIFFFKNCCVSIFSEKSWKTNLQTIRINLFLHPNEFSILINIIFKWLSNHLIYRKRCSCSKFYVFIPTSSVVGKFGTCWNMMFLIGTLEFRFHQNFLKFIKKVLMNCIIN